MRSRESQVAEPPATEMAVEKLVYGGEGLARVEGRVVLVPYVIPGETVRARIGTKTGGVTRAALDEILSPAPSRVAAPCPYFGSCGGCHYQHMTYEEQVRQKAEVLAEVLRRVGKIELPVPIETVTGEPWGYRNRTQLHLGDGALGYLAWGSHELVPIDHCPISSPRLNETIAKLTAMVRDRRWPRFVDSVEIFTNEQTVQLNVLATRQPVAKRFFEWCAEEIPGAGEGFVEYPTVDESYRVSPRSFFQVNRFLPDALVRVALDGAAGETALDLYAGVGLFSLPLARRFGRVHAVESLQSASRDLEHNAARAGVAVEITTAETGAFLAGLQERPDFVLADPPRAGLGTGAVQDLVRLGPPLLTIVACDPSTLARDLVPLLVSGYQIRRVTLVDLFPQTFHIETVVHLTR